MCLEGFYYSSQSTEESQSNDINVNQKPCEEDADFAETSEKCSVQQLLLINQESQRNLEDLLIKVREELARNIAEQAKVSANPSDIDEKNIDLNIQRFFRNYFEDNSGRTPPYNDETKQKKEANMPNPFDVPRSKWKNQQNKQLIEGIKTDGLKRKMQPLLNRQEVLEAKMDRLSLPKDLEKVYEEMKEIKQKLADMEKVPDSELLGDRLQDADWEFIANVDLDGERTGEECRLHWQNHLHPSINHEPWTETQKKDLIKVAAEHEYRDWEQIAEKLETGRTAFQCLWMFQQLDKTFIQPIFTKADDELLLELVQRFRIGKKHIPYAKVAYFMEGKAAHQVARRWVKTVNPSIKSGRFSDEEKKKLVELVNRYGAKNWSRLAEEFPGRTQYQIRFRWANIDNPSIKTGRWDYEETVAFIKKIQEFGVGKWSQIAEALKVPGEKNRTPFYLLHRFKVVCKQYVIWKSTTHAEGDHKIEEEDVYSGRFLPDLLSFLEMKEKMEEESKKQKAKPVPTVKKRLDTKRKRRKRPRLNDFDTDEEDDDDDQVDTSCEPPCLTARQKALALKKGKSVSESTTKRRGEAKNDGVMRQRPRRKTVKDMASKEQKSCTSREEDEEEGLPRDEEMSDEVEAVIEKISEKHDEDRASRVDNPLSISGPRGLTGWLKRLQEDTARLAAQSNAQLEQKKQEQQLAQQRANFKEQENSTFDVETSVRLIDLRRRRGRKQMTPVDHQLIKAVDPMWLCRNGNSGRHTKHSVRAQERTKQEKLCRADQRAMFGLLQEVFDIDVDYLSALARQKLVMSRKPDKKEKQNAESQKSQEESRVTGNLHVSNSSQLGVTPTNPAVCHQSPNTGFEGMSASSQRLIGDPQTPITHSQGVTARSPNLLVGQQTMIAVSQGVTQYPQRLRAGLQTEITGPQRVAANSQGVTDGNQGMLAQLQTFIPGTQGITFGPQGLMAGFQALSTRHQGVTRQPVVMIVPQGKTTCPNILMTNPQGVISSPQTLFLSPQTLISGPQIRAPHPQGLADAQQGMISSPQTVFFGSQTQISGPQIKATHQQGLTNVPRGVAAVLQGTTCPQTILQHVTPSTRRQSDILNSQMMTTCPQAMAARTQNVTSCPQVVTVNPQGVIFNPLSVTTNPQGVTINPQSVITNPQSITTNPRGVTVNPQEVTINQQGTASSPQDVITSSQRTIIGLQRMTAIVTSVPQTVTVSSQVVTSGPQPTVSASSGSVESAAFVELSKDDISKRVLTFDKSKSSQEGKVGGISCPLSASVKEVENKQVSKVSSQCENGVEQEVEGQRPGQIKSGKKHAGGFQATSLDPSWCSSPGKMRNKRKKRLQRKKHTKDIPLLPPNIAALQALASLLHDRPNLENQRKHFIAKFERQLQRQGGRICFRGYLEGQNAARAEKSPSKKSSTPQRLDPNCSITQDSDSDVSSLLTSSDSSIPSYSSSPGDKTSQLNVSSQLLEDCLDTLRKSDMYQVLQKRFLSLFLWPGLLSSTRIKGSLSTSTQSCYVTKQPFVYQEIKKRCTSSNPNQPVNNFPTPKRADLKEHTNKSPRKKADKTATASQEMTALGVSPQDTSTVFTNPGNQNETQDVNDHGYSDRTGVNRIQDLQTATCCHGNEEVADVIVLSRGQKRKSGDAPESSCSHLSEQLKNERQCDATNSSTCKRRKAMECACEDGASQKAP
ncbi:uncharacterized protein LOC110976323 isoform X2 [Acanthaster planci]|uniref:Uncharacterized protein LOC110976323 isoform X2 n=1 Tax=Acanthaster planci TaxID=133434 RepID=A0A8B7XY52_ACAPL|nr:uncharacterized protein LOC110976323 isoform X2 [Acanthaster planci]